MKLKGNRFRSWYDTKMEGDTVRITSFPARIDYKYGIRSELDFCTQSNHDTVALDTPYHPLIHHGERTLPTNTKVQKERFKGGIAARRLLTPTKVKCRK